MSDGIVRFEDGKKGKHANVFLDDQLIGTYVESQAGQFVLFGIDEKNVGNADKRSGLVAIVKRYAETLSVPVEITIKLPPRLFRLIPDLVTMNLDAEDRQGKSVPILFAMAAGLVDAAGDRNRFSRENALSQAAISIEKSAKEAVFEIVADAVSKLP